MTNLFSKSHLNPHAEEKCKERISSPTQETCKGKDEADREETRSGIVYSRRKPSLDVHIMEVVRRPGTMENIRVKGVDAQRHSQRARIMAPIVKR